MIFCVFGCLGEKYRLCPKHALMSLHELMSVDHHLLGISFMTSLKSNLHAALTIQNAAENICFILQAQNGIAFQLNVFLTGIQRSVVTISSLSAFPSTNISKVNSRL
jgi:hypothetical protein